MTGDDRAMAKEMFLSARELDGPRRRAFLDRACAGREEVRRRVEALLRAETAIGPTLLRSAPLVASEADRIGGYELLEVLGEGGFATVYRARRPGVVQADLALKVLRDGLDSAEALARFRVEQRALAAMDHPGIARVLDAGVTEGGRPYLVMEYVRGEPVTVFADREALTVEERVRLAIDACRAVQHAHQKGVIHRDLKPANLLAGRSGGRAWVRVIDFGVAKGVAAGALGDAGLTCRPGPVGTPAYMSPEQARGGAGGVDTRSDVYALGAVLYELLCGRPAVAPEALAAATPAEAERLVCDVDPPAPSARVASDAAAAVLAAARRTEPRALARRLRGELDWITQRAMAKEPARRYATAQALAEDLERALAGEAVEAAPPSRLYRLRRAARRNRGLVGGVAMAVAALVVGAAVTTAQWLRARRAEGVARQEHDTARQVNAFLREGMTAAAALAAEGTGDPRGREAWMRQVLDEAGRRLESRSAPGGSYADQPLVRAGAHDALARVYFALGDLGAAAGHARTAAGLYAAHRGERSREHVMSLTLLGGIQRDAGLIEEASECLHRAATIARASLPADDPERLAADHALANLYYWGLFRPDRAEGLFREVLAARTRVLGPEHPDTLHSEFGLARTLLALGRVREAEALHRKVLAARERILGADHPDTLWSRFNVARCMAVEGDAVGAEAVHREVLAARRRVVGEANLATLASMQDLGEVLVAQGRSAEAEPILREALELKRRVLGPEHLDTLSAESALGEALGNLGRRGEGLALLEHAVAALERRFGDAVSDTALARHRLEALRASR
jgi:serine/threonine protein kinase